MNQREINAGKGVIVLLAMTAALAACGGSGSAEPAAVVADEAIPASAVASPEAFSRYASGLGDADSSEPLSVDSLVPPTSETAEPEPVLM